MISHKCSRLSQPGELHKTGGTSIKTPYRRCLQNPEKKDEYADYQNIWVRGSCGRLRIQMIKTIKHTHASTHACTHTHIHSLPLFLLFSFSLSLFLSFSLILFLSLSLSLKHKHAHTPRYGCAVCDMRTAKASAILTIFPPSFLVQQLYFALLASFSYHYNTFFHPK